MASFFKRVLVESGSHCARQKIIITAKRHRQYGARFDVSLWSGFADVRPVRHEGSISKQGVRDFIESVSWAA